MKRERIKKCWNCKGKGTVELQAYRDVDTYTSPCSVCKGSGKTIEYLVWSSPEAYTPAGAAHPPKGHANDECEYRTEFRLVPAPSAQASRDLAQG